MKLSFEPVEYGFIVRLMSPLGSYPAHSLVASSGALVISHEFCFSVAQVTGKDWSFSEVDTSLTPTEITLLGSILLSGKAGAPYIYPYPTSHEVLLETDREELVTSRWITECRRLLLDHLEEERLGTSPTDLIHRPPLMGGIQYTLVSSKDSDEERLQVFDRLRIADDVILRGVAALIKAHMAWQHPEFGEAACIFLWISLDAAYSLVLRKMRENGIQNPTSSDAADYFGEISGFQTSWEKFFEYDYENRIRVIHPENRFGAEARPQLLADDFLELNDALIPLFEFLLPSLGGPPTNA